MIIDIKHKIMDALVELLNTKRLDKITVKEISLKCNISRQTFYYHFNDIYDIARQIFAETSKHAMNNFSEDEEWSMGYMRMMKWCRINRTFVYNTFTSNFGHILMDNMKTAVFNDLLELLKNKGKNLKITDEQYKFISSFYSSALISITVDWIKNDMIEDPSKIINNLFLLVGEDFHHILTRYDNANKLKTIQ